MGLEQWLKKAAGDMGGGADDGEEPDTDAADDADEGEEPDADDAEPKENPFQKSLPLDLEKSEGEGSRGGKIIGHTGSGKPIYAGGAGHASPSKVAPPQMAAPSTKAAQAASAKAHASGSSADHQSAAQAHWKAADDPKVSAGQRKWHTERLAEHLASAKAGAGGGGPKKARAWDAPEEPMGKTSTGKPIFDGPDHPGNSRFSPAEHMEAAALRQSAADSTPKTLTYERERKKHEQAAEAHRNTAYRAKAADVKKSDVPAGAAAQQTPPAAMPVQNYGNTQTAPPVGMQKAQNMLNPMEQWLVKAGIPGAEDVAGGDKPADDLPEGTPAMVQGKDVNGSLSQAGAPGGDLEPGEGTGKRLERTGPGKQTTLEDTTGPVETGKETPLNAGSESGAGLGGMENGDTGSMKKGENLDNYRAPPTFSVEHARAHAIRIQKAQSSPEVLIRPVKAKPAPKAPEQAPMVKSLNGVLMTNASDLEVMRLLKSDPHYAGGQASPMDMTTPAMSTKMCKSCDADVPSYLTSCPTCGVKETAMDVQTPQSAGGGLSKSVEQIEMLAPRRGPREIYLPNGTRTK